MPKDSQNICDELKSTVVCREAHKCILSSHKPFMDVLTTQTWLHNVLEQIYVVIILRDIALWPMFCKTVQYHEKSQQARDIGQFRLSPILSLSGYRNGTGE